MQRGEGDQVAHAGHDVVVDQGGGAEHLAAVHHPVPDGGDARLREGRAHLVEQADDDPESLAVVGYRQVAHQLSSFVSCLTVPVASPMRSTMPPASASPDAGSTSWYFSEEDPEFKNKNGSHARPSFRVVGVIIAASRPF